jgi:hypothetical protein
LSTPGRKVITARATAASAMTMSEAKFLPCSCGGSYAGV